MSAPVTGDVTGDVSDGTGTGWTRRYAGAVMNTFGTPQRVLVRGEGCHVWDADGRRYLDLLGGIAVNALGHAHPVLVEAVTRQLATLGHVSNFFATPPQIALAERLITLAGAPPSSRVFFTNSGTEAVEAAVKVTRRLAGPGERTHLVAAEGSFHGRTLGALALTHKPAYREPFEPLPAGVTHVPFGDGDALAAAVTADTAAVVLEPVQGEGGVVPAPPGYLRRAREVTAAAGALLVLDEIQTGIGRTGTWFAHQNPLLLGPDDDARPAPLPDVMTLAKGLGGGIPIGAVLAYGDAATLLGPGQHGSTFGGNPVACAAALATLDVISRDGLLESATAVGARITDGVLALGDPRVTGVRGAGLLLAVTLAGPWAADLAALLLDGGVIVNAVAPDAVRLAPPLILTPGDADAFVAALTTALDRLET